MQEIMKLAHEFLQNFCAGNQQNQALLHKHINLFLNPGVRSSSQTQTHIREAIVLPHSGGWWKWWRFSVSILLTSQTNF